MPAISLGFGEVEERLQQIRRRLNSRALQHVVYLSGTVIALLGALLVIVALRAPPGAVQLYLVAFALFACAIGAVAAARLRSQWLSLEAVARLADRQAGLDSRLATLCARRSRPQRSRLGGILLAQTLALGPRWDRNALAPRQVPRSIYLLLASLALLGATGLIPPSEVESSAAQNDPAVAAPDDESFALNKESLDSSTLPMRASTESGIGSDGGHGELPQKGGPSGSAGQPSASDGLDQSSEGGEQGKAEAGGRADQAAQQKQSLSGRLGGDKGGPEGEQSQQEAQDTQRDTADQRPSESFDQAGSATKENTTPSEQRANREPDPKREDQSTKARSEPQGEASAAKGGSKPSGRAGGHPNDSLFENGDSTIARQGEDGKPGTFALRLTGTAASVPADFESQNKKPREGIPAFGSGQTSPQKEEVAKQQVEDDPLQKTQISPEHESLLQRIFQHD